MSDDVVVYVSTELAQYHFGEGHPFGPGRVEAFLRELAERGLERRVRFVPPARASDEEILLFHTASYLNQVKEASRRGVGYLDHGDTPAVRGIYEAAGTVAGATLGAVRDLVSGRARRAFVPIGGLHHARRDRAGGFCVFDDCGMAIELLRREHALRRIAYVDIDAHHGDGVYYSFEEDPDLYIADLHEDGRFLYPGTGDAHERGKGAAEGTKLNVPLAPGAGDEQFLEAWSRVEELLERARPEIILFQCGADGLAGDPLTHLRYTPRAHRHAAESLCRIADVHCGGRILGMGGGGYLLENAAAAWCAVVEAFLKPG